MSGLAAPVRAPPAAAPTVEEIREPLALEALEPEWRGLFEACPDASPFQSPAWLLAWRRVFLHEGLLVLAVRAQGRLVGLAPFFVHRGAEGSRQLTLLGNGVSDRLDLLAAPEARSAVAEAVFDRLAALAPLWDRADFRDLPEGSSLLDHPFRGAARDERTPEEPCPAVDLPERREAVLDLLDRRRRDDLRRCARRLSEAGTVDRHVAGPHDRVAGLDELMRLHEARWRARGEVGELADPAVRRFHHLAAEALMAQGMLSLNLLRLDGRVIAAQYGLRHGGCGYSYLTAFDPEFARFSPGLLLGAFTLEQMVCEGARRFDFLRGREPYKYLWGARDQPQWRRGIGAMSAAVGEVRVRPCRESDLPGLEWRGAFRHHRRIFREALALQQHGQAVLLVAEAQGFPIGQAWLDLRPRLAGEAALVWAVRVLEEHQGAGVGRALMRALEAEAADRGCDSLELGVEKSNPGARAFYERLGWRVAGERWENYDYTLPDGRAVRHELFQWVMAKTLVQPGKGRPTLA